MSEITETQKVEGLIVKGQQQGKSAIEIATSITEMLEGEDRDEEKDTVNIYYFVGKSPQMPNAKLLNFVLAESFEHATTRAQSMYPTGTTFSFLGQFPAASMLALLRNDRKIRRIKFSSIISKTIAVANQEQAKKALIQIAKMVANEKHRKTLLSIAKKINFIS